MKKSHNSNPDKTFIILLFIGISITLYPVISNYFYTNKYKNATDNYHEEVASNNQKKRLLEEATSYNNELKDIKVLDIFREDNNETSDRYNRILQITSDGMMGYLEIPKIDIKLPIYHGTSDVTLKNGIGHLEGTSLPIGGKSTHSVLTGHRGMPSSKLFTDLNQMVIGDTFYIYILDIVLAYQVDKISIIKPDDISELKLIDNKDYVTLMTCTPYGVNTHRLLVRGKRIPYNIESSKKVAKSNKFTISNIMFYIGLNIVLMLLIVKLILKTKLYIKKEIK